MTFLGLQFLDVSNSPKEFGDWLRRKRKENYLSMEALGKKVGVSKQYISVLERAADHALTGKPVTPEREKVVSLARALGADENEALRLAGYASDNRNPQTYEEFIEALKQFGICNFQVAKSDMDLLTPEYFRSVIEFFENSIKGKIQKIKEGELLNEADQRKVA